MDQDLRTLSLLRDPMGGAMKTAAQSMYDPQASTTNEVVQHKA